MSIHDYGWLLSTTELWFSFSLQYPAVLQKFLIPCSLTKVTRLYELSCTINSCGVARILESGLWWYEMLKGNMLWGIIMLRSDRFSIAAEYLSLAVLSIVLHRLYWHCRLI